MQEVIRAAKEGNKEAFNRLYEERYKKNYYIAVKMLEQEQDAMDVLKDT